MLAKSDIQREALNLSVQERIEFVVELWDSLAPGEIPVPDWQRDLIRDRVATLEHLCRKSVGDVPDGVGIELS